MSANDKDYEKFPDRGGQRGNLITLDLALKTHSLVPTDFSVEVKNHFQAAILQLYNLEDVPSWKWLRNNGSKNNIVYLDQRDINNRKIEMTLFFDQEDTFLNSNSYDIKNFEKISNLKIDEVIVVEANKTFKVISEELIPYIKSKDLNKDSVILEFKNANNRPLMRGDLYDYNSFTISGDAETYNTLINAEFMNVHLNFVEFKDWGIGRQNLKLVDFVDPADLDQLVIGEYAYYSKSELFPSENYSILQKIGYDKAMDVHFFSLIDTINKVYWIGNKKTGDFNPNWNKFGDDYPDIHDDKVGTVTIQRPDGSNAAMIWTTGSDVDKNKAVRIDSDGITLYGTKISLFK